MKILYKELKNAILEFNLSPYELKELFEEKGIEVESFRYLADGLKEHISPAIVESIEIDGNLKIVKIRTKFGYFQVITTAQIDIYEKAVFLREGAKLSSGEVISKKYIKRQGREYVSEGMLASEKELGISNLDRLIKLPENFKLDDNILEYLQLDDYIYELYIFPNRADLMGLLGIAREIASYLNLNIKIPDMLDEDELEHIGFPIEILDYDGCYRYMGRIIKDVKIKQSPDFLRYKLHILGFNTINNVVDITNFVMWEIGQPLHAFDLDKIYKKVIVRKSREKEKILCLDQIERELPEDVLLISDVNKPIAIAGIIGELESSISENTKNVFLESALFNKSYISKASRILKLKTQSSIRFEKGLNWDFVEIASKRAGYLLNKYANGKVYKAIDVYSKKIEKRKIYASLDEVNSILGTDITEEKLLEILRSIGIKKLSENLYEIPYHRDDIENIYDIAEEVMKHVGIENINSNYEVKILNTAIESKRYNVYSTAIDFLLPRGYYEAKTYSLISEKKAKLFSNNYLKVLNPISTEMNVYRNYVISSLLESLSLNIRRNSYGTKLMEYGSVYRNSMEIESLGIIIGGKKIRWYFESNEEHSIYELKGDISALLEYLNYNYEFKVSSRDFLRTCLDIYVDGKIVGFIGELRRSILKEYDIKFPVFACEIELIEPKQSIYKEISKYPRIEKDISIILSKNDYYASLEGLIREMHIPHLLDFYPIDVYEGENIGIGNRSITIRLVFGSDERTLKDEEVNYTLMEIINKLENKNYRVRRM
ncbi:MAG: phenylalanine--tRNA ligase subunit beta [candidate division WOR-3 bacterium]|nr:phenylalanine--tRNA ligase subunit beta [candidate division WOR-3 bacterium]MCX7948035.1 phenylalanine--tRNA ligase subunit beta [candidate division WOR-3 bacterium]MDW8151068.1 phenylalanine--tRNA ligase subunit beta [candidate division WOR-3 bacterium]